MAFLVRQRVASRLSGAVESMKSPVAGHWKEHVAKLPWCVRFRPVAKRLKPNQPVLQVPFKYLQACELLCNAPRSDIKNWAEDAASKIETDDIVSGLSVEDAGFSVQIDPHVVKDVVLKEIAHRGNQYGFLSQIHSFALNKYGVIEGISQRQHVVVEFSSPNIAKRFHAGHLRSTIIGNVISNLFKRLQHEVTRINYLGDWGTQFGLLGVGFQKYGSQIKLERNAMQHLFEIYVKINEEASADPEVHSNAMDFFKEMEQGDDAALSLWKLCRDKSIEEYNHMYKRLGVEFDEYHGESMYFEKSLHLVQEARDNGLLQVNPDTGVGFIDLGSPEDQLHANLVRSDGATLYITRDIAAAIDRQEKYKFDKLLYVVENGQHLHFKQLVHALRRLGHRWADRELEEFHVKFGRIEGMSTRRGEVVFLSDILDEAKSRMSEIMRSKKTTKLQTEEEVMDVADKLGTSAIIIQDLKQKRLQNYKFSWDRMLDWRGDTGVSLQYTHARLRNIEHNSDVSFDEECDLDPLQEDSALNLVFHLARFDEVLQFSTVELEPCHLVQYLFMTSRIANVAADELYVQGQPHDVAKARLLLFRCARTVLATGLKTLGIEPLDIM